MTQSDQIERAIDIEADATTVWALISQPGWWVNKGTVIEHRIDRGPEADVVHDPDFGAFTIRTERQDPPHHVAFRWLGGRSDATSSDFHPGTLVEFWIDPRTEGGVTLRVVESGFAALPLTEAERRTNVTENTEGWESELQAARVFLTAS